jgi:hypothetical protein
MSTPGDQDWLRDLPVRSEEIGFSSDELIACKKCGRPSPPNRTSCLYCGEEFDGAAAERKLDIRQLEDWEKGFNVVVTSADKELGDQTAANLASLLGLDIAMLMEVLGSRESLPIGRVETEEQAAMISQLLMSSGIKSTTITDESLLQASPPVRLRAIEFVGSELVIRLFNSGESHHISSSELALIVAGTLFEGRTESVEKRKRGATKTLSKTQLTSDEPVIDIYSKRDPTGWRIRANGFDFGCLGAEKALTVAENMAGLTSRLLSFSPSAKLVEEFVQVRVMLECCWPSESRKDAYGFQRSGFGRKDLASVMTTNNSLQMTKYSRLQWHLL